MNFLKKLFGQAPTITSNAALWEWFASHADEFYRVVKQHDNIEGKFINKLSPKLAELREGYLILTGMADDNTAELIITSDGKVKDFVFVEALVASAPGIRQWKFTAHKPPSPSKDLSIEMYGTKLGENNLSFFANEDPNFPDNIDITIVYPNLTEGNKDQLSNAIYIFLDNYLGELNLATTIDMLTVTGSGMDTELIPLKKLQSYLDWREKEFVEKYDGIRHNTANDSYSVFEGQLENEMRLVATINVDLINWDRKASHPWILVVQVSYNHSGNGMPDEVIQATAQQLEEQLAAQLENGDGHLNVGRETGNGKRTLFFACKDFRRCSSVTDAVLSEYTGKLDVSYDIYKDKYWRTFEKYNGVE